MLASSQKLRDNLAASVGKLDSYIDLLRAELGKREAETHGRETADDPPA
jgi:hypothetical protein